MTLFAVPFLPHRLHVVRHAGEEPSHIDRSAVVANLGDSESQYLFGFVRRLGLTDEQADDAVQEVLARLLAQLRGNAIIANPRAWAYRSIYRLAMDQHRMRRRLSTVTRAIGWAPARVVPGCDVDNVVRPEFHLGSVVVPNAAPTPGRRTRCDGRGTTSRRRLA